MGTLVKDILKFAQVYQKFWIIPFVMLCLAVGGLVILAEGSTIAPFIYALF